MIDLPHSIDDIPDTPFPLFQQWFEEARKSDPNYYNAMSVASIQQNGSPTARIMLLKDFDENGFVFYTNQNSRKGHEFVAHPYAGLCFFWKELDTQVRIEGPVSKISDKEADDYFATRPRGSKIGAWASKQSQILEKREDFEDRIKQYEQTYEGRDFIPRPDYWGGYRLIPERIEFWRAAEFRLHTRIEYWHSENGWEKQMLYP